MLVFPFSTWHIYLIAVGGLNSPTWCLVECSLCFPPLHVSSPQCLIIVLDSCKGNYSAVSSGTSWQVNESIQHSCTDDYTKQTCTDQAWESFSRNTDNNVNQSQFCCLETDAKCGVVVAAAHLNTWELRWNLRPHRLAFSAAVRCSIVTFLHIWTNWLTMNPNRKANPEPVTETSARFIAIYWKKLEREEGCCVRLFCFFCFFQLHNTSISLNQIWPAHNCHALDSWNVRLNQQLFQFHYSINWGKLISLMSSHSSDATQTRCFVFVCVTVSGRKG